jgi:hypothetical protein
MENKTPFSPNSAYSLALPIWQKCRDCSAGEDALHAKDLAVWGTYLRPLNPSNISRENTDRNESYINMARYQNFVGSTEAGFLGMAYRKKPVLPTLPLRMEYLINNVNGAGLSLEQQSKKTLIEVNRVGRDGLLTEMPQSDGQVTIQDEQSGHRPSIVKYSAESIIDWFPYSPSAETPLQYIILMESKRRKKAGSFESEEIKCYRVLHMENGSYHQSVYEPDENGEYPDTVEPVAILAANSVPMNHIPFSFVGSINNDPSIDKPVILDIVNASLGMYQEDANLRISSFGFSAGTLAISDDRISSNVQSDKSGGVQLGDGKAIIMGSGGSAQIIVPPDNPLAASIKDTDQKNLAELGAQVVMPSGGVTSVAEVKSKESVNASKLTVSVENVSDAYNEQLKNCAEFLGETIPDSEIFMLNTEFFEAMLSPEDLTALISSWHGSLISKEVAQRIMQEAGNIPSDIDLSEMNGVIDEQVVDGIDLDA